MSGKETKERGVGFRVCKCITSKYGGKIKTIRGKRTWLADSIPDNETILITRGNSISNDGIYTSVIAHLKTCKYGKRINKILGKKKETNFTTPEDKKPFNFATPEDKEIFDSFDNRGINFPEMLAGALIPFDL